MSIASIPKPPGPPPSPPPRPKPPAPPPPQNGCHAERKDAARSGRGLGKVALRRKDRTRLQQGVFHGKNRDRAIISFRYGLLSNPLGFEPSARCRLLTPSSDGELVLRLRIGSSIEHRIYSDPTRSV
jgi:hypothetical protein